MWETIDKARPDSVHYSIMRKLRGVDGMDALRGMFPEGKASELNFVLFSTSGVHGTYKTLEEVQKHMPDEVTFLIVHPRLVALRYGVCVPRDMDDMAFLKALRESSHQMIAQIGLPTEKPNETPQ